MVLGPVQDETDLLPPYWICPDFSYSPTIQHQSIEVSDSNYHTLATVANLGQAPGCLLFSAVFFILI